MGVSIGIYAIQAGPDHAKKVTAARALTEAGIPWPYELEEYFGGDADDGVVDDAGRSIALELPTHDGRCRNCDSKPCLKSCAFRDIVTGYNPLYNDGCVIELKKLPPGATHIRVRSF